MLYVTEQSTYGIPLFLYRPERVPPLGRSPPPLLSRVHWSWSHLPLHWAFFDIDRLSLCLFF